MNYPDIALLIVLLVGTVNGLRIGLIQSLTNLIGWIIALVLAIKYYDIVADLWTWASDKVWQQNVLAFASIVLCVMMMTWGTIFLLDQVFKKLKLTPINRLVGGMFGGAKSSVVILVLLNALTPILGQTSSWKQSQIIQTLSPYAPMATQWSKQMKQKVGDFIQDDDKAKKTPSTIKSNAQSSEKPSYKEVKNPFSS